MYTVAQLRTALGKAVTVTTAAATLQDYQDQSISQMIDACFWRIQDLTFADCRVDGVTRRWFLPGENISVLPAPMQMAPDGLNTARVASPTAAPAATAVAGGGSPLPGGAGTYQVAYAYVTGYGVSGISPVTSVTIAAGQRISLPAIAAPTGTETVTNIRWYGSSVNDSDWKLIVSVAPAVATTYDATNPGAAQTAGEPFLAYLPFSSVSWNTTTPDALRLEDQVKADGTAINDATDTIGATISASVAPALTAGTTYVRVWYLRRVPMPDFTLGTSVIRAPEQFARIASLGYYLATLADNQPGGDMRSWRAQSQAYLTQADLLYRSSVPAVLPQWMRGDQWQTG